MTDGLYIDPAHDTVDVSVPPCAPPVLDLTTFAQWIAVQQISAHIGLLDEIGNDLYRRHWPTAASDVKRVAKDLHTLTRHGEPQGGAR